MSAPLKWLILIGMMLGVILLTMLMANHQPATEKSAAGYKLPPAALNSDQKSYLHVDQAFSLAMRTGSARRIDARFEIAPGYYLYKDKIKIVGLDKTRVAAPSLPEGKTRQDQYFGISQVFADSFSFSVPLEKIVGPNVRVSVTYQGCANQGICYPPVTKTFSVKVAASQ